MTLPESPWVPKGASIFMLGIWADWGDWNDTHVWVDDYIWTDA